MKNYNNPNLSSQEIRIHQISANQTVGTIQNVSKNIKAYSLQMRQVMKTLRESGVIPEIALAIREGSFAVRDTVKEINETAQELKNNGVVNDTVSAVENTLKSAEESMTTVKEITADVGKMSPNTTQAVKDSIEMVRNEASHMTEKMMKDIKTKVSA